AIGRRSGSVRSRWSRRAFTGSGARPSAMSSPSPSGGAPLSDRRELVEYLAAGAKPRAAWRIGTEHEKFVFRLKDRKPVPYDGSDGIRALLQGLTRFGWQPVLDAGNLIGLSDGSGGAISLEPGG